MSCAAWLLHDACAPVSQPQPPTPRPDEPPPKTDLYVGGQDGYHTYRIPVLIVGPRGTLLAFAEGRKNDFLDQGDIDVVLKRSSDGGRSWSAQALVHEEGGSHRTGIGNPTAVVDRDTGTLWLLLTRNNRDVLVTHSTDDGVEWAMPREITADVKQPSWSWYATGPGIGIQIRHGRHKGRLIVPCDHREPIDGKSVKFSHVFLSDDHGRSWRLGGPISEPHTDECQVAELSDGTLLLNMRNFWGRDGGRPDKAGRRINAWSRDGGESWSPVALDETLLDPNCHAALVRYRPESQEDRRLLFANPATSGAVRERVTVRLSLDDGRTWPHARLLEAGRSAYSSIAVLRDGSVGILFERGNQQQYWGRLTFVRFGLDWLSSPGRDRGALEPGITAASPG